MSAQAQVGGGRRLLRVALRVAVLGVVLLALAGGTLAWLANTTAGARWVLARAARGAAGTVRIGAVSGSIARGLELADLSYSTEGLAVEVGRLTLQVDLDGAVERRVIVERLVIENVRVTSSPAADSSRTPAAALPGVHLPLDLVVRDARIDGLRWRGTGNDSLDIGAVRLEGAAHGDRVRIGRLLVTSAPLDAEFAGELQTSGEWPLALTTHWIARPANLAGIEAEGEVRGSIQRLAFAQRLTAPHPVEVTAQVDAPLGDLRLDVVVRTEAMPLRRWSASAPAAIVTGRLRAVGRPDSLRTAGTAHVVLPGAFAFDLRVDAARHGDRVRLAQLDVSSTDHVLGARATATLRGIGGSPAGEGQIEWTRFIWPPAAPVVQSAGGTLAFEGSAAAWHATLDTRLATPWTPAGRWHARMHGDSTTARLDSLVGVLFAGAVRGRGEMRWAPAVAWRGSLEAHGVNPGARWKAYAGALDARVVSEGRMRPTGAEGHVRIARVRGTLRGRPLDAAAAVRFAPDAVGIESLSLDWGAAHAEASGRIADVLDARGEVHVPNLGLWLPGARGALTARARFEGPRGRPRAWIRASGDSLLVGDLGVRHVELDADADLSGAETSAVHLVAADLGRGGAVVDRVALTAGGVPSAHEIEAHVVRAADSLDARALGAWDGDRWTAELAELGLRTASAGAWRLAHPAHAEIAAGGAALDSLALVSGEARLAAGAGAGGGAWRTRATLDGFALERLDAWMPQGLRLRGPLAARLDAHGAAGGPPITRLSLVAGPGEVDQGPAGRSAVATPFDTARAEWRSGADGLTGTLAVAAPGLVTVDGRVRMPAFGSDTPLAAQTVNGRITVDVPDLAPFESLWTDADSVRGRVHADLTIAGTAGEPRVTGAARVENASARLPAPGLRLRDASIEVTADGSDSLTVRGGVRSGPGRVRISGHVAAARLDSLRANLRIQGERFQVVNRPDARLLASPDLRLAMAGPRVDVSGDVHVPLGEIDASRSATREAVPLSSDVVIDDRARVADEALRLHTRVRVVLGDSLSLNAYGLKAKPRGSVLIVESPGRDPVASGELTITGGTYRAYGQDLTIQRGRLLYAGGPVTDPGLDIRASRTARDGTVAGIEVRGTALDPVLTVFSDPDLPEEEALAYIVLGRPLDQAGSSDGQLLANAARSAGLKGGNLLAGKIASQIGLEQASIETESGALEDASLVLGTYLSPRVYLGYGVGLFKPANAVKIRYRLSPRWALEAESAEENSAEIQFSIER